MDNYGRQLNNRREQDARSVRNNEILLANSVSSRKTPTEEPVHSLNDDLKQIELIAEYFQLEVPFYQVSEEALPERIDLILRPTGIMKRHVRLDGPWWKKADAPMLLTFRGEERLLAVFPDTFRGFYYRDSQTGEKVRITKEDQGRFEEDAFCFYRPLPAKKLSGREFIWFLIRQIRTSDLAMYVLTSIFMALIGVLPTYVTQLAFSQIIPSQKVGMLISLFVLLVSTAASSYLMRSARFSINLRIQCRLDLVL